MTPAQFNTKLAKHFKRECIWECRYDTICYTVNVYKTVVKMKTLEILDSKIAFGIGTTIEKAFEDCIESLRK